MEFGNRLEGSVMFLRPAGGKISICRKNDVGLPYLNAI